MKLQSILLYTTIFLISISFFSCTNDTIDDIETEEEVLDVVTFQDIQSTFVNVCQVCHTNPPQNGAPIPLISLENVKEAIQNRDLIGKISKNEGESGLMPLGGPRLPQQTIVNIIQWKDDGFLEN